MSRQSQIESKYENVAFCRQSLRRFTDSFTSFSLIYTRSLDLLYAYHRDRSIYVYRGNF